MSLEFLGRLHKELSITSSALYEVVLSISERVNRKTQIIRLHWHASGILQQIDEVTAKVGRQVADHISRPSLSQDQHDAALDTTVSQAVTRVQTLKQSLTQIDGKIRELKLEAIHEDSLKLQQDLTIRSDHYQARSCRRPNSQCHATIVLGPYCIRLTRAILTRSLRGVDLPDRRYRRLNWSRIRGGSPRNLVYQQTYTQCGDNEIRVD